MSQFRSFGFREAYGAADSIRSMLIEEDPDEFFDYLDDYFPIDADFKRLALEPQQKTFLHEIIERYLDWSSEYLRYKADPHTVIVEFASSFAAHGVPIPSEVQSAVARIEGATKVEDDEADDDAVRVAYDLYGSTCIPRITTEVFTLLFGDRRFLLALNERLAALVTPLKVADHADLLERDGVVKRCAYWPAWLRRALVFRDKGHCAICLNDISGLVSIGEEGYHVDHIVPLDLGGTNDPTNLQLLCAACNLVKGAGKANTSSFGMVYW